VGGGGVGVWVGVKGGVEGGGGTVMVNVGVRVGARVGVGPEGVNEGVSVGPPGVRVRVTVGVNVAVPAPPGVLVSDGVKVGSVPVRVGVDVGIPVSGAPTTKYGSVVLLSMTAAYANTGRLESTTMTPLSVWVEGA